MTLRSIALISLITFIVFLSPSISNLHSGGTGADGGHFDNNTGEYHYHHGYSAHEHYDIDGDGSIDCPYNFNDNTSEHYSNSNEHSSTSKSQFIIQQEILDKSYMPIITSKSSNSLSTDKKDITENVTMQQWPVELLIILFLLVLILFFMNRSKKKKIEELNTKYNKDIERLIEQNLVETEKLKVKFSEELSKYVIAIKDCYGENYLYDISGAKETDIIDEKNLPRTKSALSKTDPYILYTNYPELTHIYTSEPIKYHKANCQHANFPINAYTIVTNLHRHSPCKMCHPSLPDISWAKKYLEYKEFLDKYILDEHKGNTKNEK